MVCIMVRLGTEWKIRMVYGLYIDYGNKHTQDKGRISGKIMHRLWSNWYFMVGTEGDMNKEAGYVGWYY